MKIFSKMNTSLEEYIRSSQNATEAYYAYSGSTRLTDTFYLYVNTTANTVCLVVNIVCFLVCKNIDKSVRKDFSTMYGYIEIFLLVIVFNSLLGCFVTSIPRYFLSFSLSSFANFYKCYTLAIFSRLCRETFKIF